MVLRAMGIGQYPEPGFWGGDEGQGISLLCGGAPGRDAGRDRFDHSRGRGSQKEDLRCVEVQAAVLVRTDRVDPDPGDDTLAFHGGYCETLVITAIAGHSIGG